MPFDWGEFLNLARYLQGNSTVAFSQEAGLRTAVSRAYYAAFCHAVEFARRNLGYRPTYDEEEHKEIRKHLAGKGRANIADFLNDLRQWRNDCDYRPEVANIQFYALHAIERAEQVFAGLGR